MADDTTTSYDTGTDPNAEPDEEEDQEEGEGEEPSAPPASGNLADAVSRGRAAMQAPEDEGDEEEEEASEVPAPQAKASSTPPVPAGATAPLATSVQSAAAAAKMEGAPTPSPAVVDPDAAAKGEKALDYIAVGEKKVKDDPKAIRETMAPKFDDLNKLAQMYQAERVKGEQSLQLQEVAEKIGHALGELGAGYQGMKAGVDAVSGLKFDKTDWSKRYDTLLAGLRTNLEDIRSRRSELGEETRAEQGIAERGAERVMTETGERKRAEERTAAEKSLEQAKLSAQATQGALQRQATAENVQARIAGSKEIEGVRAGAAQQKQATAAADKEQKEASTAIGGYQAALRTIATADTPKEKQLAVAELQKLEPTVERFLGPDVVQKAKQTYQGKGWLHGDFSSESERADAAADILNKATPKFKYGPNAPTTAPTPKAVSPADQQGDDPVVANYAKTHGISYQEALNVKKNRVGGQ